MFSHSNFCHGQVEDVFNRYSIFAFGSDFQKTAITIYFTHDFRITMRLGPNFLESKKILHLTIDLYIFILFYSELLSAVMSAVNLGTRRTRYIQTA